MKGHTKQKIDKRITIKIRKKGLNEGHWIGFLNAIVVCVVADVHLNVGNENHKVAF